VRAAADTYRSCQGGVAGQCQHLRRSEEAEEGRPGRPRTSLRPPSRRSLLFLDEFQRQDKRHGQRGARGERRDLAQRGRDRVPGQVQADARGGHDGRPAGVEARGDQLVPPAPAGFEVDRHQPQPLRDAEAELDEPAPLPGLGTRLVDLEYAQAGGDPGAALGEGVQAGSEDDVLADAVAGLFHYEVLDETGPGHGGCPGTAGGIPVHVRAAAPAVVRGHQPQADLVVEHMRRRVDPEVHGPPQGDPHR
jgi:hypothetical protein